MVIPLQHAAQRQSCLCLLILYDILLGVDAVLLSCAVSRNGLLLACLSHNAIVMCEKGC